MMSDADDNDNLLPEGDLKQMSRHIKDIVPNDAGHIDTKEIKLTLNGVFRVARAPGLPTTHRVAAWNTLCALIDRLSDSDAVPVRDLIWGYEIWNQGFNLYIEQSALARPKSAKQLLSTLNGALQKTSAPDDGKRSEIAAKLLEHVRNDNDLAKTKASMQALAYFLARDVLTLDHIAVSWRTLLHDESDSSQGATIEDVLLKALLWVGKGDFGSVIGQLANAILDKADSCHNERWPIWMNPLDNIIQSTNLESHDLKVQIFPVLFKRSLPDYVSFLYRCGLENLISDRDDHHQMSAGLPRNSEKVLHAALQAGKDLGLLFETGDAKISTSASGIFIPVKSIGSLLSSGSRSARLTGLSLLISSHSMTMPFPAKTFSLLKRHLHHSFADTDANFRSEVFSQMQKLMDRLRAVTAVLARRTADTDTSVQGSDGRLRYHQAFAEWLIRFLGWELRPTASYQTHISALKTLSIVARSGIDSGVPSIFWSKAALAGTNWAFNLEVITVGTRRLLLDLLINPFDDVRQTAAAILGFYSPSYEAESNFSVRIELSETIHRAERLMLLTGRADQADGVAHMHNLLYQQSYKDASISPEALSRQQAVLLQIVKSLEDMIEIAKQNLSIAVQKNPMHGLLTSLRYVITESRGDYDFDGIPNRLVASLQMVWEIVKPVLCNDAPEGYLPEDVDDMGDVSTKDTLSYCWRALKESSLLLGIVISQPVLSDQARVSLSELCFTQLAELRHRGAFSTVAQTWVTCCTQSSALHNIDGLKLLQEWYNRVIYILKSNATINTRRSAGLPSLVCGLLIADKSGHLFRQAFNDLRIIARQVIEPENAHESSLAQVHALNCIKDMLKNARLGEHSERFLPVSLQLASESLRSKSWAVRNGGLMLFRAVIDRLLGTSDAYLDDGDTSSTIVISPQEQPELVETILDLVIDSKSASQDNSSEGVFLALQLLQRTQVPDSRRKEIMSVVYSLTASRSWHLRDKAALAYAAIVLPDEILQNIAKGLATSSNDQNALHGALMCVKYLIKRFRQFMHLNRIDNCKTSPADATHMNQVRTMISCAEILYHRNECSITKAAYVDVVTEAIKYECHPAVHKQSLGFPQQGSRSSLDIRDELYKSFHSDKLGAAEPTLRSALARAFSYDLTLRSNDALESGRDTLSLLLTLADKDSDACCLFFETSRASIALNQPATCVSSPGLFRASSEILNGRFDIKLKCTVQRFLLDIADHQRNVHEDVASKTMFIEACKSATNPVFVNPNQLYADLWLQLQGVELDLRTSSPPYDLDSLGPFIIDWIRSCCDAVRGDGLFSPEAAAFAISRVRHLWPHLIKIAPSDYCGLCFALYDLLNDDDEDIRILASGTVTRVVARPFKTLHLEPQEAAQGLLGFMISNWHGDPSFFAEAFLRAYHISEFHSWNVADELDRLTAVDTALFAEEKQNLYIDDAEQIRVWTQVLARLDPVPIPKLSIKQLSHFASKGLDTLRERALSDGALGWSTKPEAFTFGLQVIYGAEYLLDLVQRGVRLPIRPSVIKGKLGYLSLAAAKGAFNDLWTREVERIVNQTINWDVKFAALLLGNVSQKIAGKSSLKNYWLNGHI